MFDTLILINAYLVSFNQRSTAYSWILFDYDWYYSCRASAYPRVFYSYTFFRMILLQSIKTNFLQRLVKNYIALANHSIALESQIKAL